MGFEPITSGSVDRCDLAGTSKRANRLRQSTPGLAAQGQRAVLNNSDLAAVVDAWDRLPGAVRAGIVAMVKAATGKIGG
jgi:hypothetical protein